MRGISSKPAGAVTVPLLWQNGLLDIDEPIAAHWPEFGQNDKHPITPRHLLTHTAGIRTAEATAELCELQDVIAALENPRIERDCVPGKNTGYHAFSGWQVLDKLVLRLSEIPYAEIVRTRTFHPLEIQSASFNMKTEEAAALGGRIGHAHGEEPCVDSKPYVCSRNDVAVSSPASRLRCTASDMVRFYRMFLGTVNWMV